MAEDAKIRIEGIFKNLINDRRLFHRYPESGFAEFWTASKIAELLEKEGYELYIGRDLMSEKHMMGLPAQELLDFSKERALKEGANPKWVEKMTGGFTAVAAVLKNGPGPVAAFRFDIDSVDVDESNDPDHLPYKEGFASMHKGSMHACGHDGHITLGLALARLLSADRAAWKGTVKLIFQPAEEGVRGAKSIAESGFLDDAYTIVAGHLGMIKEGLGTFFSGVGGFLSTTKLDFVFTGRSAHAGGNPELGKNALLAASAAAILINGIPRHSGGATRINIGRLEAGSGRNVIAGKAIMAIETRGENSIINDYMEKAAIQSAEGVAMAYGVKLEVKYMGGAIDSDSDSELMELAAIAAKEAGYETIKKNKTALGGSEDYSYMMERVKSKGGKALYSIFGADIADAHHSPKFDFTEASLESAAKTLWNLAKKLLPAK
ncbi:p-aminobenzoyl-glutamate hydrolase subunit AbgA [Spirochaetota bacterium]